MPVPVPVMAAYGIEGGDWLVLGRLYKVDPATYSLVACAPADVGSISRTVVSLADGVTVVAGPTALTVASAILSALSTGNSWRLDTTGFNFVDQIPGALFASLPGVEVRYVVTLSGGAVAPLHIDVNLKPG